jgi:hypothetical protein
MRPVAISICSMKMIAVVLYLHYLAGVDVLHCLRDLHGRGTQVCAVLANFLRGKLRYRNEYCSFRCHLLFFVIDAIYYPNLQQIEKHKYMESTEAYAPTLNILLPMPNMAQVWIIKLIP